MSEETPNNLRDTDVDRLGKALLTLARELWAVKDRQKILEAVLEDVLKDQGASVADRIEKYQPDVELAERLAKDRAVYINSLLASLEGK